MTRNLGRSLFRVLSTDRQSIIQKESSRHCLLSTSSTMSASGSTHWSNNKYGSDFSDPDIQKFLKDIQQLMIDEALVKGTDRNNKVVNFKQPTELKSSIDLTLHNEPTDHDVLLQLSQSIIDGSVKTGHPRFFNQLYSGLNAYGVAGSWLTDSLNTNIHTYEVSPMFILIEKAIMEKLTNILGYKDGDGLFCPGGSFSNIMAMNLARYKQCPDFKKQGMYGLKRMKFYTSAEAHYSLVKGAVFLGLGSDSVVKVDTDPAGRIIPGDLEKRIKEDLEKGEAPVFVMATAGTTVLGAYDKLDPLAEICNKYSTWLHCDACWGGGALLSDKHRNLMASIERTHSVSWNFHKMSAAPIQCSAFLVQEKGLMEDCNRFKAEYLFQPDKCYDTSYDIGDKTVQCGRKVDALKLWLMWKGLGDTGMAAAVDNAFDNARYFTELLRKNEGFRLVIPEFECTNICFWYIPKSLRGQEETPEWWEKVAKVAPVIKQRMMEEGTMMIGYQPLTVKGLVNFFRIIISSPSCDHSDMEFVVKEIERLGEDL
ncbi:hypothetical protein ACF0H5_012160 [Mactra antiquata]